MIKSNLLYKLLLFLISLNLIGCNFSDKSKKEFEKDLKFVKMDSTLIPALAFRTDSISTRMHPLSDKIKTFLKNQDSLVDFNATGLNKNSYLKLIDAQVRAMLKYQDKNGRIIDPVENVEKYYTTPCFAHSVSVLVSSNSIKIDNDLAISGMKALDIALTDMVNATVNGNHGDFYTWPVMLAYNTYKPFVSDAQLNSWNEKLKAIKPEKLYRTHNDPSGNNWVLVHTAGEFLRAKAGFTSFDYVEKMLGIQLNNFTELGMYNEHGNPLPYDLFPRHYLTGMLQLGYEGNEVLNFRNKLWKGAWTSLFMQSPFGELPTGYRSSHHIWNEAEQCVVFEIYANAYAKAGLKKEAGAFKRASMLSLKSMQNWIQEDGSGFIVKNKFPINKKHGYEVYSVHTCYNMLATSMLAQAWQFSDDSIKEHPAPADTGGFVIPILEPFHKIFANANGTYIEYDTNGDQKYNPTGILRLHVKGSHPQLGPSDGIAEYISGKNNIMALGPQWQNIDGSWSSLAKANDTKPNVKIIEESDGLISFSVTHYLKDKISKKEIKVIETISIENGLITVQNEFKNINGNKKIIWPILVNDGMNTVNVNQQDHATTLSFEGKSIQFSVISPEDIVFKKSEKQFNHRNGIVEYVSVEFKDDKITYTLKNNLLGK